MHRLLLPLLFTLATSLTAQDLAVFAGFTDHAVLQREVDHPFWGQARRNQRVTVAVDDKLVQTRADRQGQWSVDLPRMPAGGPHRIRVFTNRESLELTDVYFGDVYLLSGQSNMEWRLVQSDPDSTRARAIADPLIRHIKVARTHAATPQAQLPVAEGWKPGVAAEIADFSGVGSYFAHYLREGGVEVPIGLVNSSWGGSRIEPWISAEALTAAGLTAPADAQSDPAEAALASYRASFGAGEPPTQDRGREMGYTRDDHATAEWGEIEVPGLWESRGYANVDGVMYFRRTFELSAAQAAGSATLHLGAIDDGDETYVNGQLVGTTPNAYSEERIYELPAGLLRAGENNLTVRVIDTGGGGGFSATPDKLKLVTAAGSVPLAGTYKFRVGEWKVNPANANQTPTLLYNAMIAPLRNLPLKGVLWYQGESNAGAGDAERYADHMRLLVTSWRARFERPDLPFYWVQLANFRPPPVSADEPGWAVLRAAQTAALDLPGTGQAVITDIGEADDIHPRNKWEVGRRLSLHALRDIYGRDVQARSPVARDLDIRGSVAEIGFSEVGGGLTVHHAGNERYRFVRGLTVQDGSGQWHWAIGTLDADDNRLLVVNPAGTDIVAVRYAWSNNPDDANLFSREGLPVTPFELKAE